MRMDLKSATAIPQTQPLATAKGNASAQSPAQLKLAKLAKEFEAIMLGTLCKSMQPDDSASSEDSLDPASATLKDMGTQAFASALADRGGIGIARMVLKSLQKPAEKQTIDRKFPAERPKV